MTTKVGHVVTMRQVEAPLLSTPREVESRSHRDVLNSLLMTLSLHVAKQ